MKPGQVTFRLGPNSVVARLGANGAQPADLAGGFEQRPRPERSPYLHWAGTALLSMSIDIMLDGWTGQTSVESQIALLEAYVRPTAPGTRPLPIGVEGAVPYQGLQWVCESLHWEPANRRDSDAARIRQAGTITLVQYMPADVRVQTTVAKKTKQTQYVVKRGDTLMTIATKIYGNAKRWPEIAKKNGIKGGARDIKVGQKLKLP